MTDELEARAKLAVSTAILGYRHEDDGSDSPSITWESLKAGEQAVLSFAESVRAEATLAATMAERELWGRAMRTLCESTVAKYALAAHDTESKQGSYARGRIAEAMDFRDAAAIRARGETR